MRESLRGGASRAELQQPYRLALRLKLEGHAPASGNYPAARLMAQIGG